MCIWSSYHGITNTKPTGVVLYRIMQEFRFTIGIDEVNKLNFKEDSNIITIVNSSNVKGILILRVNTKRDTIDYFDAFGVKYFTRVGNIPNKAWNSSSDPAPMIESKGRKEKYTLIQIQ